MSDYSLRSWLFTTDHQRIGRYYQVATTLFLLVGALLGLVMRLELLTPPGDLVEATTYEDLFRTHGLMMVHLFLLPLFPAVLGNLRGMTTAFPRLNLVAWWVYVAGALTFTASLVDASIFLTSVNLVVTLHRRRAWRGSAFEKGMYAGGLALLVAIPAKQPLYALLLPATGTYFAVGHFHLLAGAVLLVYLAALGRRAPSGWIATGFLLTFVPYFVLGYLGLPARYHDYPPEFQPWQIVSTMGAVVLAGALIIRRVRDSL